MEEVFEKLKTLQKILSEKIALERTIQEIPKLLVTQEELLKRIKTSCSEKGLDYKKAKTQEAEYRNLLYEAEEKREKAEKNLEFMSTQREWEALSKERDNAEEKAKEFRGKLLREERTALELAEQITQSEALIEQQEAELAERRRGIQAELAGQETQMNALSKQEAELTANLDPEVFFKFERIIRNKMGQGIVAIKSGVCDGCHMILPAQFANDVRIGKEIVFCPYCSRILFYEESEQTEEDFFNDEDSGSLSDLDDIEEEDDDEEEEEVNIDYEE